MCHGIKEKTGFGIIKITICPRQEELRIIVIDSKVGISLEKITELNQKLKHIDKLLDPHEHIGLINTAKRLALLYNMNFLLVIRSAVN